MALGLESKREGLLNHLSWKHNKNVWGVNFEVYTGTELDNAGLTKIAQDRRSEKLMPPSRAQARRHASLFGKALRASSTIPRGKLRGRYPG